MESNDYWRQMIADVSGLQVIFDSETEEGTSRGAAQLVAIALQGCSISSFVEEITASKTSEPRSVATSLYLRKADQQSAFIDSIWPPFPPGRRHTNDASDTPDE
jgi:sugar (pentulose or hexulose) kinase